ncbi:MAG: type II toxin-antitoxin system HicB family antitoxin [Nanoarchaeota archaeon]
MAEYNIIIEKGEDGYLISEVLEIPGCHTQAKTMDELLKRTKEAIELCLEVEEDKTIIEIKFPVKFIGLQKIEV